MSYNNTEQKVENLLVNNENLYDPNNENLNQNNYKTYIKQVFQKNFGRNILILAIFLFLFILEFFIRESLFNSSIKFEERWQNNALKSTIAFYKIITKVAGEYLIVVPVGFVLIYFSFIKSSFYIAGFIFVMHLHSWMKIWYASHRPFWKNKNLYKEICDAGFGNPSGHSLAATYIYLTLYFYLSEIKLFKDKFVNKIILGASLTIYVILIILSRLILGIHSINQVIYGSALGIFISLIIVVILQLHKMSIKTYKSFFKEKKTIIFIISISLILQLFSILSAAILNGDKKQYNELSAIIDELCGIDYPEYRRFNLDGLFGSFVILSLLGMYLGQVVFWYWIDTTYKKYRLDSNAKIQFIVNMSEDDNDLNKENNQEMNDDILIDCLVNNWNKNTYFKNTNLIQRLKLIYTIIICCLPLILFVTIKADNMILLFIFRFAIPFFTTLFLIYSYGIYNLIVIIIEIKDELIKRVNNTNSENRI